MHSDDDSPSNTATSSDLVHRFLFEDSDIRGEILTLERSFLEASAAQDIERTLMPLFGEFLAGTAMVSQILKFEGLITLQARGDGAVPIIMAEANDKGELRGVVTSEEGEDILNNDTRSLKSLPELLGTGLLSMTLDPRSGQRYQGIVPLDGANLAECLEHYFEQSEQIPTAIVLFANDTHCGGIFLQNLPAQTVLDLDIRKDQWDTVCQLLATTKAEEFFRTDHASMLFRLFHEQQCKIFEAKALSFACSCSRERSAGALLSLGEDEIKSLMEEQSIVEIDCQFCGAKYTFNHDDLTSIKKPRSTLH